MSYTLNSMFIAIISGLLTTFIIIVLRGMWKKIIFPWYENTLYRDALIEGKWISRFVDSDDAEELDNLEHKLDEIENEISNIRKNVETMKITNRGSDDPSIEDSTIDDSELSDENIIQQNELKKESDIDTKTDKIVQRHIKSVDEKEEDPKFIMTINRIGHKVKGDLICLKGGDEGKTWSIEGKFQNLLLTVNFESTDPHSYDRGCIVMMLINNGKKFLGHLVSYADDNHSTFATKFEMSRE